MKDPLYTTFLSIEFAETFLKSKRLQALIRSVKKQIFKECNPKEKKRKKRKMRSGKKKKTKIKLMKIMPSCCIEACALELFYQFDDFLDHQLFLKILDKLYEDVCKKWISHPCDPRVNLLGNTNAPNFVKLKAQLTMLKIITKFNLRIYFPKHVAKIIITFFFWI